MQSLTNFVPTPSKPRLGQILVAQNTGEQWVVVSIRATGKLSRQIGDCVFECRAIERDDECVVFQSQLGTEYQVTGSKRLRLTI